MIESGIGGKTVATTIEGRERYPISVRYARDFREDLDALRRVLVATPTGAQVPISALADIDFRTGPPSIRNENGQLVGFVFVDATSSDIEGYVRAASARISERVKFPPGYYIQWAGQFEYLKNAERRLAAVIPFTLLLIFILIFMNTRSVARTAIVLLAVPFSLVGAFWLLYLLNYNLSVAVWVGLIALAGLDAETGVVMLLYLDHSCDRFQAEGRLRTKADLNAAVLDGAVQRIRPKIMTVCAIVFSLLPIMWSPTTQAGADVMKRIAAPMIGGVVTSAILELLLYPAIYAIWRGRHLPRGATAPEPPVPEVPPETGAVGRPGRALWLVPVAIVALAGLWVGGHYLARGGGRFGVAFAHQGANGLTVDLFHPQGQLHLGDNDVVIEFRDAASGELADVGVVKLALDMNMPGMVMHSGSTVTPTDVPGRYSVKVRPDMGGDWTVQLSYEGARGAGTLMLTVNVRQ